MQRALRKDFAHLFKADKAAYFRHYVGFFRTMGYDTVSFEQCITRILPGGGALYSHADPVIKTRGDFENYPWKKLPDAYFEAFRADFAALRNAMPEGMRAIGGPGNGVFEIVQDLCGYEPLCFLSVDDPELYAGIFEAVAALMRTIWERFLEEFADVYCVCRFGDDLGFRSQTLLPAKDIRRLVIPQYRRLADTIHAFGKPFLLHSCGCIFDVMDDLINVARIDAKHSNEDAIALFDEWVDRYGDRIGNFGGIDTDVLCSRPAPEIERYVARLYGVAARKGGGAALGSGNSIPEYVPLDGYLAMANTVRRLRGDDI
jgi:uroporphyrinogen decarboxylase